jgi:hypothetical protein
VCNVQTIVCTLLYSILILKSRVLDYTDSLL